MKDRRTTCPQCGSANTRRDNASGGRICENCEHRWGHGVESRQDADAQSAKPRIFLSYGRRDAKELANRLRKDLANNGYEVWQDTRRIKAGRRWDREIETALRHAQVVVAILSPHAVRRAGDPDNPDGTDSVCLDEIAFARFTLPNTQIVPVLAVPCEAPFGLDLLERVDLCAWRESEKLYRAGYAQLVQAITAAQRGQVRYRDWVPRLGLEPLEFASFLHERRRDFCGREWLFKEMERWRTNRNERALLITGDPGTGKSAIVAELVHRNPGGQVLAYHCCQADTQATLQPGRFVRSLAAMIADKLPAYAERLKEPAIKEMLTESNAERDPGSAFEGAVLGPLHALPAPPKNVRYVLIDALDEALQLDATGAQKTVVDLLATRLERLPAWMRVVATTRKERPVLERLRSLRAKELDAQDPRNLKDIDRYVDMRLTGTELARLLRKSGVSAARIRKTLQNKSAGNFLYVQQALLAAERGDCKLEHLDKLPPGLTGFYQAWFKRCFPSAESYGHARRLLQIVVAALEALTERQIAELAGLDRESEVAPVLGTLSSFLPERSGRYAFYHKSMADWLTSEAAWDLDHRICYRVREQNGHEQIVRHYATFAAHWNELDDAYGWEHLLQHCVMLGPPFEVLFRFYEDGFLEARQRRHPSAERFVQDLKLVFDACTQVPDPARAAQVAVRRAQAFSVRELVSIRGYAGTIAPLLEQRGRGQHLTRLVYHASRLGNVTVALERIAKILASVSEEATLDEVERAFRERVEAGRPLPARSAPESPFRDVILLLGFCGKPGRAARGTELLSFLCSADPSLVALFTSIVRCLVRTGETPNWILNGNKGRHYRDALSTMNADRPPGMLRMLVPLAEAVLSQLGDKEHARADCVADLFVVGIGAERTELLEKLMEFVSDAPPTTRRDTFRRVLRSAQVIAKHVPGLFDVGPVFARMCRLARERGAMALAGEVITSISALHGTAVQADCLSHLLNQAQDAALKKALVAGIAELGED